jgi:hypothetical protein
LAVGASAGLDGSLPMPLMSKVDLFAAIRRDSAVHLIDVGWLDSDHWLHE